ncbi:hypothetical protein A3860_13930 [Niastella vici]|uniref:Uncharacterized protein n=1 Tax=Niastella vici TaxID=1703345 RepID=A0A1V9G7G1_9BACT|nr:hypothetical protein A3860_13930 [Niastella vici]
MKVFNKHYICNLNFVFNDQVLPLTPSLFRINFSGQNFVTEDCNRFRGIANISFTGKTEDDCRIVFLFTATEPVIYKAGFMPIFFTGC